VVIEAPYEDFLSPDKVHHWSAAFCARAIADLYAVFPRLRVVLRRPDSARRASHQCDLAC
jgi:hypothetical protein